jgi:hypothetical protein
MLIKKTARESLCRRQLWLLRVRLLTLGIESVEIAEKRRLFDQHDPSGCARLPDSFQVDEPTIAKF